MAFISRADIAVIGLAVMGQNLILNMNDHGYVVCAYNRTPDKVTNFLENEAKNTNVNDKKLLREIHIFLFEKKPSYNFSGGGRQIPRGHGPEAQKTT